MSKVRPWLQVVCYAEFPDDDLDADKALDELCDAVTRALDAAPIPFAISGSWSVRVDANGPAA